MPSLLEGTQATWGGGMNTEEALERIESFKKLEKNWDSYGGLPIHPAAIERAKKLVDGFFVCPISDGNIGISFGDEDIMLVIDVEGGVSIPLI